jgi:hypothetical protein
MVMEHPCKLRRAAVSHYDGGFCRDGWLNATASLVQLDENRNYKIVTFDFPDLDRARRAALLTHCDDNDLISRKIDVWQSRRWAQFSVIGLAPQRGECDAVVDHLPERVVEAGLSRRVENLNAVSRDCIALRRVGN